MAQNSQEPAPEPAEEQPGRDLPLIELEAIPDRPPSRRKRLAQVGIVVLAALVTLALFWNTSMPARPAAPAPAVVSTIPQSPPALLIYSSVNYGAVTINGKKQLGTTPMLVIAHSNTYNVSLDAPPFPHISCHLSLPVLESVENPFRQGDCIAFRTSDAAPLALNGVVAAPTVQLYIALGPYDLPPEQQSQLMALLTPALKAQQTITVPAGSYVATGFEMPTITSQRTNGKLQASAIIAPVTQNQWADSSCAGFICAQPIEAGIPSPPSGQQWGINVWLALRWHFSDASGTVVDDVTFGGNPSDYEFGSNSINLFLAFDQAKGWTITQVDPVITTSMLVQDTFCSIGETILQQVINTSNVVSFDVLKDRGAQGCVIEVMVNNSFQGTFLWRFGVLLTVDPQAHATAPQLPMAPQAEVDALGA